MTSMKAEQNNLDYFSIALEILRELFLKNG